MVLATLKLMCRSYRLFSAALVVTTAVWILSSSTLWRSGVVADFFLHYLGSWQERTCERNKEACLMAKQAQLDALHTELSRAVNALADQKGKIARDLGDRQRDLATHTALLEEGRQLYGRSVEFKSIVRFAGRDYASDALKRRLEALYRQGPSLQALVKQAKALDEAVDRKLNDLLVKKSNVRAARDILPSQIELVRANMNIGDIDAILRDVTKLSDTVKATVRELEDISGWLTTTRELLKRKIEADRSGQQTDFGQWLNTAPTAPSVAARDEAR